MQYALPVGIAVLLPLLWAVYTYNRFVTLGRRVGEAWSGISVQLKRRHDLVPALAELVKGYAAHERTLFAEIAAARVGAGNASAPTPELADTENRLGALAGRLFAVSEAYPELRADGHFLHLQQALSETEDHLQMARRYYNGTVRNYMIVYESFPSLLIPKMFSFAPKEYFQLDSDAEQAVPEAVL